MFYRMLADIVVVLHLLFIVFVLGGGVLVLFWRRCAWLHLPAVLWAILIELTGGICPLTPLENWLRLRGEGAGYHTSFIEHYLIPVIYPAALTYELRLVLALIVVVINAGIYAFILRCKLKRPSARR